jgi:hypothetical protein
LINIVSLVNQTGLTYLGIIIVGDLLSCMPTFTLSQLNSSFFQTIWYLYVGIHAKFKSAKFYLTQLGNGSICLGMNYSVLNEAKQNG